MSRGIWGFSTPFWGLDPTFGAFLIRVHGWINGWRGGCASRLLSGDLALTHFGPHFVCGKFLWVNPLGLNRRMGCDIIRRRS